MSKFFAYVVIYGLLFGIPTGLMISCNWRKWYGKLFSILISIIITGLIVGGGLYAEQRGDEKIWNNGYCECGGKWDLVNVAFKGRTGARRYIYECPKCSNVIDIHSLQEVIKID